MRRADFMATLNQLVAIGHKLRGVECKWPGNQQPEYVRLLLVLLQLPVRMREDLFLHLSNTYSQSDFLQTAHIYCSTNGSRESITERVSEIQTVC
jgi:hypothetical protein